MKVPGGPEGGVCVEVPAEKDGLVQLEHTVEEGVEEGSFLPNMVVEVNDRQRGEGIREGQGQCHRVIFVQDWVWDDGKPTGNALLGGEG
jgi:hypothetical protein